MQYRRTFWCALGLALCLSIHAQAAVIAFSTFDTGADGWTLDGSVADNFSWQATGGNPGGHLHFVDNQNPGSFFVAPAKFLGNWSALDGTGALTYDERVFSTGEQVFSTEAYTVILSGPGGSATWVGATPGAVTPWIGINVPIQQGAWTVNSGTWQGLLNNVASMLIRAELFGNNANPPESEGLDNVVLSGPVPEPAPLSSIALGIALGLQVTRTRARRSRRP